MRRLRALEGAGVIRKYASLLEPQAINLAVTVWIKVRLDLQIARRFDLFEQNITRRAEVIECYLLSGEADYLVRVVVSDVAGYERFLKESLSRIEGVVSSSSSFGLKVTKYSTALPLRARGISDKTFTPEMKQVARVGRRRGRPQITPQPTMSSVQLDDIDRHILAYLQEDARISNTALADRVGLSPAPCLRRVRALEKDGVIRKYVTLLEPIMVKLAVTVWTQVRLDLQVAQRFTNFEQNLMRWPEVLECYLMAGEADYLIRVVVPDVAAYERFLKDWLSRTEGVVSTNSSFVLKVVKYSTVLPVESGRTLEAAGGWPARAAQARGN
jgi:DNA-binding Lrp family transcriptional regulator